jgi:hypothetical protein
VADRVLGGPLMIKVDLAAKRNLPIRDGLLKLIGRKLYVQIHYLHRLGGEIAIGVDGGTGQPDLDVVGDRLDAVHPVGGVLGLHRLDAVVRPAADPCVHMARVGRRR